MRYSLIGLFVLVSSWTILSCDPSEVESLDEDVLISQLTTDEDTPLEIVIADSLMFADVSSVDASLIYVGTDATSSNHAIIQDVGEGKLRYTPPQNFNGEDIFYYTVRNGDGLQAKATAVVSVNSVNDPPIALDDTITTVQDEPLIINVKTMLLANDNDPVEGDEISLSSVDPESASGG